MKVMEDDFSVFGCRETAKTKTKTNAKKWIRCKEGVERYSLGRTKLTALAREAGAVLKIDSTLLIDVETLDRYIETFRIPGGSFN